MLSEPMTLYKLMNLYMLRQVSFPLTNAQLTDFFLQHEYTSYFTLQQALKELQESGLVRTESTHNTLSFFGKNISPAIVEDMDHYLKENRLRMRNEVGVVSDYFKSTSQDYTVHCEVREGKSTLIDLNISVPDREQAEDMCARWKDKSQTIYAYIMKTLMGSGEDSEN